MAENVLSVDIGTTSLKAGLFTANGEVVSFCSIPFSAPENRFVAEAWFWALKGAVDKLKQQTGQSVLSVAGIAVSGNGPTVVADTGLTIRWNEFPPVHPDTKSLFIPQILELRLQYSETFSQTWNIFSGPEYLISKLTNKACTILPEERFTSAYWTYSELTTFDIPAEKLPPFVELGANCGNLLDDVADFFGIDRTNPVPVFGVGPDFVSALIGTNTVTAGEICDRSGSSEGINLCIPEEVYAEGLRTLPSAIPGLWNISALIPDSAALEEAKRFEAVKAGVDKLRAVAKEHNFPFAEVMTVTGGQAKDDEYLKRKEAAVGIKLDVASVADAELLGDAIVAFTKLGKYSSIVEAAQKLSGTNKKTV